MRDPATQSDLSTPAPALQVAYLPWKQRFVVLGMLIGLQGFASMLGPYDIEPSEILPGIWFGLGFSLPFLAAAWGCLSNQPLATRIPQALGYAAFGVLAFSWRLYAISALEISPLIIIVIFGLIPTLAIMVLLAPFRIFFGWRICLPTSQTPKPSRRFQFSLWQVLVWMTLIAIFFGFASWIDPNQLQNFRIEYDEDSLSILALLLVSLLPVFLTLIGFTLSENNRRKYAVWTLHLTFFPQALLYLLMVLNKNWECLPFTFIWNDEIALFSGFLAIGFLFSVIVSFFILRLCGYRLVRFKNGEALRSDLSHANNTSPTTSAPSPLPRKRSPFLYLVAILTSLGLFLGWLAWIFESARWDEKAQQAINQAIETEWKILGADQASTWDGKISHLSFSGNTSISRAVFSRLKNETRLDQLNLSFSNTRLSRDDLRSLGNITQINSLTFINIPLTDDDLIALSGLTNLQSLTIENADITDAGLIHLQDLNLTSLGLMQTKITDTGLKQLKTFKNLHTLSLVKTNITDAGLTHLKEIINLQALDLSETRITDAGLMHLKEIKKLSSLNLSRTSVTDAGMEELDHLHRLRFLDISNTQVTPFCIIELKNNHWDWQIK